MSRSDVAVVINSELPDAVRDRLKTLGYVR